MNIIEKLYTDEDLKRYCKRLCKGVKSDDLHSEYINVMLGLKEEKLKELSDKSELKYYSIAIIRNLVYNKSSSFNKLYSNHSSLDATREGEHILPEPIDYNDAPEYYNDEKAQDIFVKIENALIDNTLFGGSHELDIFELYFLQNKTQREVAVLLNQTLFKTHTEIVTLQKKIKDLLGKEYKQIKQDLEF